MTQVEKWDVFELALQGRQERNPFTDYEIHGIFYHKKETLTHPYLKEKIEWGLVPYMQALLLARTIRGDIDEYPPFLWK